MIQIGGHVLEVTVCEPGDDGHAPIRKLNTSSGKGVSLLVVPCHCRITHGRKRARCSLLLGSLSRLL